MPHVLAALCSRYARCRAAVCTKPVIRPCRRRDLPAFCELLARYFREDLHLPLTDEQAQELAEDIYAEMRIGVPLELAFVNGEAVGFIDHQTDHPASSWCFHEGWACIRELYVVPERRSHGITRALIARAEAAARRTSAPVLYLTADDAIPFWEHLGFRRSGRINEKNGLEELEKPL